MKWILKSIVLGCVAVITLLGFILLTKNYYYFPPGEDYFYVYISAKRAKFITDEKFLSVALDTSFMKCLFHALNDSEWQRLEELCRLLSPAYIRLGGTLADQVIFNFESNNTNNNAYKYTDCLEENNETKPLIITGDDWIKINDFANKSKLNFLIDLNVLLRNENGWDSSNAEKLLQFSQTHGFPLDFQLGNEPNSFTHVFNVTISGKELAKDFDKLRYLLDIYSMYNNSSLIGPDVTQPKTLGKPSLKYLREFLSNTDSLNAVSWHQYYLNGRTCVLKDFLNPIIFNELQTRINLVTKVVQSVSPKLPIWLSETGSAYGGGAPELSDRFVASFLWMDKLGLSARSGISVVIRQSLLKENYALIDSNLIPSPDFWLSFFYKKLVGNVSLAIRGKTSSLNARFLRFYSHCVSPDFNTVLGPIIAFAINLSNDTEKVIFTGIKISYPINAFIFTSGDGNLTSKSIALNGKILEYQGQTIYDLLQLSMQVKLPLVVPAYSIVFWIFQDVGSTVCI